MKVPRLEASTVERTRAEVLTSMVEDSMKNFGRGDLWARRRPVVGLVKQSLTWGPFGSMVIIMS